MLRSTWTKEEGLAHSKYFLSASSSASSRWWLSISKSFTTTTRGFFAHSVSNMLPDPAQLSCKMLILQFPCIIERTQDIYSQQLDKASKPEWRTQRRNFIYTNVNHPWALRKRQRKTNSNKYNGLEKMAERCDYILTSKIPLSSKLAFRRQWINKAKHILICQKSAEKKTPMDKNLK